MLPRNYYGYGNVPESVLALVLDRFAFAQQACDAVVALNTQQRGTRIGTMKILADPGPSGADKNRVIDSVDHRHGQSTGVEICFCKFLDVRDVD
jgi:hypothetical protein